MKKVIYIFIVFVLLGSCDCNQNISGNILDSHTKKPIKGVVVYNKNKLWCKTETDEQGYFELSNVSGGLSCPPMKIIVAAIDYEKIETEIKSGGRKEILLSRKIVLPKDALTYKIAIQNIRDIFEEYKTNEEALESDEHKMTMTKSLNSLKNVTDKDDLALLINIWNYYDPTDYSCRNEIFKILIEHREMSIMAVKDRMKHKMDWETANLSGTEFKNLLAQLESKR